MQKSIDAGQNKEMVSAFKNINEIQMVNNHIDFRDRDNVNLRNFQNTNQNEKYTNDSDNLNSIEFVSDMDDYFSN